MNNTNILTFDGLKAFCKDLRKFNAQYVYINKLRLINDFFKKENLDSVVIGLSGGIDSSLVYKLMIDAAKMPGSPLKKVLGVFMPIKEIGITGQDKAELYVNCLIQTINSIPHDPSYKDFKGDYKKIDLSKAAREYYNTMGTTDPWVCGQIASIVRTPALYGMAAKLQHEGYKSIVAGTTNRDEGAYIGFFGKASDGMVDLQPIADLHKSEVYALAELCGIPKDIITRPPEGDVWDAKTDEEMIGASYDILEMYQILIENDARYLIDYPKDCPELLQCCVNIEVQHKKNEHKYKVGSPARYIDVMKRTI